MKCSKYLSTIFLSTVISLIYLFGFIFWFYKKASGDILESLKESLSTTSSFFGGVTTLIAAYVAVQIFKEWKKQARYLDSIKLVNKIKTQINTLFFEIESKREFQKYHSYYLDMTIKVMQDDSNNENNRGLLSGVDKSRECHIFKESLHPIIQKLYQLQDTIEELSTYLDLNLNHVIEKTNLSIEEILIELCDAHRNLMQAFVGLGTLPNSSIPKTVEFDELQLSQTILLPRFSINTSALKPESYDLYEKYFTKVNGVSTFSYCDVLNSKKNEIWNAIKEIRAAHIE